MHGEDEMSWCMQTSLSDSSGAVGWEFVLLGCCWNLCKEPLYLPKVKWNCVQTFRQTAKPSKGITGDLFHSKIWKTPTREWLIDDCPLVHHQALAPATLDLYSSYPLPACECPPETFFPQSFALSVWGRPKVSKDYCHSGPALNQWMMGPRGSILHLLSTLYWLPLRSMLYIGFKDFPVGVSVSCLKH